MKVTTFCKAGVALGAAALLVGGIAVPAMADPTPVGSFGTLVGLGSDTTQDVVNGLATSIGSGKIASYDANQGAAQIITRKGATAIPRVSGSGAGRDELLVAIGALGSKSGIALSDGTSATITTPDVAGKIDFARSSGGPGASDQNASGVVTYVPFARDAVDVAYSNPVLAKVPLFVGSNADAVNAPSLYRIYAGDVRFAYMNADGSYNSVGKTADAAPTGTTAYKLQPLLPKFGSGTRSYFAGQVGITDASGYVATHDWIKDTSAGAPIEEHNGKAIADETSGNTIAIAPFSISQWVAQANKVSGVTDRRSGVTLAALSKTATGQVAPVTGSGTDYATNAAYGAMVRDVYNIVPSKLADDPTSDISKTFIGKSSLVCTQTAVITKYGFLPEPGTSAATTCGYDGLRAFTASASSTTLSVPATGTQGSTVSATATVTSNGDQGGTVNFVIAGKVAKTAAIKAGATSVTAAVPLTAAGKQDVTAVFVPALAGIGASTSAPASVDAAAGATASSVTFSAPAETAGKSTTVTATVKGVDAQGGTVKLLSSGKSVLATAKVAAGSTKASLKFVPLKASYSLSASYTPATTAVKASTSAAKTVKVAKGAATITTNKVATTHSTKGAALTVKVAVSKSTATGTITVKEGTKTLVAKKALKSGKLSVTLPKLKVGTHKLTVKYSGSSIWKTAAKSVSVQIVK